MSSLIESVSQHHQMHYYCPARRVISAKSAKVDRYVNVVDVDVHHRKYRLIINVYHHHKVSLV
jgi:hypothetical protein